MEFVSNLEDLFIRTRETLTLNLFDSKCMDKPLLSTKLRTWARLGHSPAVSFHISKLIPVILHPSIATVMARAAETDGSSGGEGWTLEYLQSHYGQSNVEILGLSDSSMGIAEPAYLLKLPRALKAFTYISGRLIDPTTAISPRIGLTSALNHVAKALTKLEITLKGNQRSDWPLNGQNICSLHHLTSLKSLKVEHLTFSSLLPLYFLQPVVRLAPLLPPSLENLTLYPTFHYAVIR
ncbi:hypothetical protein CPB86DRAFT_821106 [Serendipita vermifera]|nr:hypothetical protein CPB86DRAFT_821106 [Serendipita vermifera]